MYIFKIKRLKGRSVAARVRVERAPGRNGGHTGAYTGRGQRREAARPPVGCGKVQGGRAACTGLNDPQGTMRRYEKGCGTGRKAPEGALGHEGHRGGRRGHERGRGQSGCGHEGTSNNMDTTGMRRKDKNKSHP
eukprot:Gb_18003 [translate_table: standard]